MPNLVDLQTKCSPNWCPGCGNLPIWAAFKNTAVEQSWDNTNTAIVAGIGCHGHIINFTKITSFEGLHGRALPAASGIKMANHKLNVIVFTGDGDCLGEGGNHFMHTCRRNHDISIFIHDNALYALTTGQTSPATQHGTVTKSTPQGNPDYPINPMALALTAGATFIARAYAGDIKGLAGLMAQAVAHKGTSVVDILQPCTTFNKVLTHPFLQQNTYYLGADYDPTNKAAAFVKMHEFGEKAIPLGVFYKEEKQSYEAALPQLTDIPLVKHSSTKRDMSKMLALFA